MPCTPACPPHSHSAPNDSRACLGSRHATLPSTSNLGTQKKGLFLACGTPCSIGTGCSSTETRKPTARPPPAKAASHPSSTMLDPEVRTACMVAVRCKIIKSFLGPGRDDISPVPFARRHLPTANPIAQPGCSTTLSEPLRALAQPVKHDISPRHGNSTQTTPRPCHPPNSTAVVVAQRL